MMRRRGDIQGLKRRPKGTEKTAAESSWESSAILMLTVPWATGAAEARAAKREAEKMAVVFIIAGLGKEWIAR